MSHTTLIALFLVAAIAMFLFDGFRIPAAVNWVSLGFALVTAAVFVMMAGSLL
jgi:hypothetical protein